jgi:hypothetical protein
MNMTIKNPNAFASILIARFLCERRPMPGVSGTTGYLYHVPIILKDFIQYVTEDPIPQQNHCKVATGVGNRSLLQLHLPLFLKGFTEDLSGYLEGPGMDLCKEARIYDQGDYTNSMAPRGSGLSHLSKIIGRRTLRLERPSERVSLRLERQFEADKYVQRKTESQRWLESLGFETLGEMLVLHRNEFDEWVNAIIATSARCKPISSEEMTAIECLIGAGTWQRVLPVKVTM